MNQTYPERERSTRPARSGGLPVSVIVVAVLAVAVLVWLLLIRGGDSGSGGTPVTKSVKIVTAAELPKAVADVGYTVYWLGEKSGIDYELTKISDGRTYIRYLAAGEPAETETPYLTVGSYAQANAYKVLQGLGEKSGARTVDIPDGGVALTQDSKPDGVYAAFSGADAQIEVYDPESGRALDVARSGALTPVR